MQIKKLYTILIVLFPILSIYVTIIPEYSIADFLLTLIFPFVFIKVYYGIIKLSTTDVAIFLFIIYLVTTLFYQIIIGTDVSVLSTIRYVLYLLSLHLALRMFDFNLGITLIEYLSKYISIYVILQFITYTFFNLTLPWKIPILPIVDPNFLNEPGVGGISLDYRPTGIFLEPTHYSQFIIIYLLYVLNKNTQRNTNLKRAILPTFGILASGSSMGLIFIILAYIYWFISMQKKLFSFSRIIIISILIFITCNILFQIEYFKAIYTRLMPSDGELYGPAMGYRFNSVFYYFENIKSISDFLIGFGRGSEKVYFTGIFYFLNANGLIGVVFFISLVYIIYKNTGSYGKMLAFVILLLSFGSEIMANFGILFYLSFCINKKRLNIVNQT